MLKIAYHPIYKHHLPDGHRFPMEKYDLLPQQLVYEGTCNEDNFFEPEIPNNKYFFLVHDAAYVSDLLNITLDQKAARKIGFPLSEIFDSVMTFIFTLSTINYYLSLTIYSRITYCKLLYIYLIHFVLCLCFFFCCRQQSYIMYLLC